MRTEHRGNRRENLLFHEEVVEMRLSADVKECSEPIVISILLHQVTQTHASAQLIVFPTP